MLRSLLLYKLIYKQKIFSLHFNVDFVIIFNFHAYRVRKIPFMLHGIFHLPSHTLLHCRLLLVFGCQSGQLTTHPLC